MTVRWAQYQGEMDGAELSRILGTELGQMGDTVLVWVNQGDLLMHGKEMRPATAQEVMRDALQWVSNNVGAHPENIRKVVNQALREASAVT